jgi:hypothetical protein
MDKLHKTDTAAAAVVVVVVAAVAIIILLETDNGEDSRYSHHLLATALKSCFAGYVP